MCLLRFEFITVPAKRYIATVSFLPFVFVPAKLSVARVDVESHSLFGRKPKTVTTSTTLRKASKKNLAGHATMNGVTTNHPQNASNRLAKPPPTGPTPPAPATAPPVPPTQSNPVHQPPPLNRSNQPPPHNHTPGANGHHHSQRGKKRNDVPVDPATMYESLKNRIAALEEEEVIEEEEERRYGMSTHAPSFSLVYGWSRQPRKLRSLSRAWRRMPFMQNTSNW
jgi:hypothetical protein